VTNERLVRSVSHEIGDTMSALLSTGLLEKLVLLVRNSKTDDTVTSDER
jgi:hypothetical protein